MEKNKLLYIYGNYRLIGIHASDEKIIDWIISNVKELDPKTNRYSYSVDHDFLKRGKYSLDITAIDNKSAANTDDDGDRPINIDLMWFLIRSILDAGWEPLGHSEDKYYTSFTFKHTFQKEDSLPIGTEYDIAFEDIEP